jgi:Gluconate 2-dehydrogenase subunit 3
MKRRDALKVLGVAAAASACRPGGDQTKTATGAGVPEATREGPAGTPSDPDLIHPKIWWQKQMTPAELTTLAALCDTIIPEDDVSPSASVLGVPDYIDEWASAPYDWARDGLTQIRKGLAWLDTEADRRFGRAFAAITPDQRNAIADDICYLPKARPEHRDAAEFFDQVRDLTATGFYTTEPGMKDVGYVGNVPLDRFPPPPPEVLKRLGLEA